MPRPDATPDATVSSSGPNGAGCRSIASIRASASAADTDPSTTARALPSMSASLPRLMPPGSTRVRNVRCSEPVPKATKIEVGVEKKWPTRPRRVEAVTSARSSAGEV
jgi:hypothetical protein